MLEFKNYSKTPRLKNLHVRITQKLDGTNGVIAIGKWNCGIYCSSDKLCNSCKRQPMDFKVGSRSRWLPSPEEIEQRNKELKEWKEWIKKFETSKETSMNIGRYYPSKPEKLHDNHSFAKWVYTNKDALIEFLGEGYHYGEWCGPGIQNGEGLKEKGFYLFSPKSRYFKKEQVSDLSDLDKKFLVELNNLKPLVHFVPELYSDKVGGRIIDQIIDNCRDNLNECGSRIGDGSVKPEGLIVEINSVLKFKVILNESDKSKGR